MGATMSEPKGYHINRIEKGVFGKTSKIREEVEELEDAEHQGNKVMMLVELSDIIGAIEGYLKKEYGDTITLSDLQTMARATQRAFESGARQ